MSQVSGLRFCRVRIWTEFTARVQCTSSVRTVTVTSTSCPHSVADFYYVIAYHVHDTRTLREYCSNARRASLSDIQSINPSTNKTGINNNILLHLPVQASTSNTQGLARYALKTRCLMATSPFHVVTPKSTGLMSSHVKVCWELGSRSVSYHSWTWRLMETQHG